MACGRCPLPASHLMPSRICSPSHGPATSRHLGRRSSARPWVSSRRRLGWGFDYAPSALCAYADAARGRGYGSHANDACPRLCSHAAPSPASRRPPSRNRTTHSSRMRTRRWIHRLPLACGRCNISWISFSLVPRYPPHLHATAQISPASHVHLAAGGWPVPAPAFASGPGFPFALAREVGQSLGPLAAALFLAGRATPL